MGYDPVSSHHPFKYGLTARDLFAGGFSCYSLPRALIPIIIDALAELTFPEVWTGDDNATRALAMRQVDTVLADLWHADADCACDDCEQTECPPCQPTTEGGVRLCDAYSDCEDCEMPNCYLPAGSIRVYNGVLQGRDACGDWYDIATISNQPEWPTDGTDDTAIVVPDGAFDTATSCSKATVFADILFGIVDSMLDAAGAPDTPFKAVSDVHKLYPTIDFGDQDLLTAYSAALPIAIQGYASETEDSLVQQEMRAGFANVIAAGNQGMTEDEYKACQSVIKQVCGKWFTLVTYPTAFGSMLDIYLWSAKSIGKNDVRKATEYAAPTGLENCGSPSGSLPIGKLYANEDGFYVGAPIIDDVTVDDSPSGYTYWRSTADPQHDIYGLVWLIEFPAGYGVVKRMNYLNDGGGAPFDGTAVAAWGNTSEHEEYFGSGVYHVTTYDQAFSAAFIGHLGLAPAVAEGNVSGFQQDGTIAPTTTKWDPTYGTRVGFEWHNNSSGGVSDVLTISVWPIYNFNSPSHE